MNKALHDTLHTDVREPTTASVVARLAVLASTLSLVETTRRYFNATGARQPLRKGELMSSLVVLADESNGALTLAAAARAVQQQHGPIDLKLILDALTELSAHGHCTSEYNDDGTVERWQFSRAHVGPMSATLSSGQPWRHDA